MNRDATAWMALARTPETRARIRRWVFLKRVFFGLACLGLTGFVITVVVAAIREVLGKPGPWWVFLAAFAVLVVSILPWCLASFRLDVARYADGKETGDTITKIVVDEHTDPEALPAYDITIAARLPNGGIRRTCRVSERTAPELGQMVRFRHNTGDPDDLKDVLFLGFVDARDPAEGPVT
ncbi:hypothetical protein [Mycobacteroides abscessus]|uniref:hypothetical protein n=1 Tax=Mycobacteroides abscessus TaxID=36809 RepID=UPI0009A213EF|nr:hypothetical protein [Mycobacteroides abscessus]RIT96100.1 hypothetical protein D2F00_09350 [Mycobacteroides abscessus]